VVPLPDGSGFRNEPAVSTYDAGAAGVDRDLRTRLGPVAGVATEPVCADTGVATERYDADAIRACPQN
jgi:hypothetical protein